MQPQKKRFSGTSDYTINMVRRIAGIDAIDVAPTLEQATLTQPEEIKIPLQEALASKRFTDRGFDIYKEADTDGALGGIWMKKEIIDEKTGEKQEWLVAYTNDDMDVEKKLIESSLKKVADYPVGWEESLEDAPTPDFAKIPAHGGEVMDSVGHALTIDSIVTNDNGKQGKVVDILSPNKILVRWDDRPYGDQEGGDTIDASDLVVVGSQKIAIVHLPEQMRGYEAPLPELQPGDRVEDTRTKNIGLVKDIQGDLVEVDMGTHSMKVPISAINKLSAKTAGQPKPQDIPIAPGIKSKNITMDETGGQGTAKVTIEFTNVDQGLKFYQEQAGTSQPAPEPKEEAPKQEAPQPQQPAPKQPQPQGPIPGPGLTPAGASLKFAYAPDYHKAFPKSFQKTDDDGDDVNTPPVGSFEWTDKVLKEADEHFSLAHVVPDQEDLISYIYDIADAEGEGVTYEDAVAYYKNWQKGFNKKSLGSADEIHTTIRIKRILEDDHGIDAETAARFANDIKPEWQEYIELPDEAIYDAYREWAEEAGPRKMTDEDWEQRYEEEAHQREQFGSKRAAHEFLEGGKADGKPDSEFDEKQLSKGIKTEMGEHTDNRDIAKEIAKDHLVEMPNDYYNKLNAMEKGGALRLGWKELTNPTVWNVQARAINRSTKTPVGDERWEKIDTKTNRIFDGCKTAEQIKARYEAFWAMDDLSPEIVKVKQVVPVK